MSLRDVLNQNSFAEVLWWLGSLQLFLQEKGEILLGGMSKQNCQGGLLTQKQKFAKLFFLKNGWCLIPHEVFALFE